MDGKLCCKNWSSFWKDNFLSSNSWNCSFWRVFCSLEKIPFGIGTDGTSSDLTVSSELQRFEGEEEVTSLIKEDGVLPGRLKGTFSTTEIEEQGVESSVLSERGVERKNIRIRRNKFLVI